MQVLGRAGEVLYLTQRGEVRNFAFRRVMGPVDRVFIAVLASPDLDAARAFYQTAFVVDRGLDVELPIKAINEAFGFPEGSKTRLRTVLLHGSQEVAGKIEIDQHPIGDAFRPVSAGALPPGVAMRSFETPALNEINVDFLSRPQSSNHPPYDGRRAGVCRGTARELVELIETA